MSTFNFLYLQELKNKVLETYKEKCKEHAQAVKPYENKLHSRSNQSFFKDIDSKILGKHHENSDAASSRFFNFLVRVEDMRKDQIELPSGLSKSDIQKLHNYAFNVGYDENDKPIQPVEKISGEFKEKSSFENLIGKIDSLSEDQKKEILKRILKREYVEHFITWETSHTLEINAKKVFVLTKDLEWATQEIQEILQDLKNNKEKYYYYLISDAITSRINSNIYSIINAARDFETDVKKRLCIKQLSLNNKASTKAEAREVLALLTDIVLYKETNFPYSKDKVDILVKNTVSLENTGRINKKLAFDVCDTSDATSQFEGWFNRMWDQLPEAHEILEE